MNSELSPEPAMIVDCTFSEKMKHIVMRRVWLFEVKLEDAM